MTTIGVEFVVPPVAGVYLDRRLETSPLAVLVGALIGFAVAMAHLLRMLRERSQG